MYGVIYQTVEHAFQAAKTLDLNEREKIRQAKSSEVKQLGKKITLRSNWLIFRLEAMEELLRRKFSIPALKERLLSTGDLELIERNFWKDIFWGTCHGVEENNLGKLLMKIRKEFQEKDRMSF
jgi:hypothetical protein